MAEQTTFGIAWDLVRATKDLQAYYKQYQDFTRKRDQAFADTAAMESWLGRYMEDGEALESNGKVVAKVDGVIRVLDLVYSSTIDGRREKAEEIKRDDAELQDAAIDGRFSVEQERRLAFEATVDASGDEVQF